MTERSLQERLRDCAASAIEYELEVYHDHLVEAADTIDAKDAILAEAVKTLQEIEQLTWQEGATNIATYQDRLIGCRRLSSEFLAKLKAASAAQGKEVGSERLAPIKARKPTPSTT